MKTKFILLLTLFSLQVLSNTVDKDKKVINVAMSAAFVSESGIQVYDKITTYLAKKLGTRTEFITGLGYETINDMIKAGVVDVAFVCGLPFVLLEDEKNTRITLIAAPVMKNKRYSKKPIYFSDLIVRKDFSFNDMSDLKGKRFVYNEEISNSGYNMPRNFFIENDLLMKGFFGELIRSGSHEESIKMVAEGKADYSFVDSLVLEYDLHIGKADAQKVKVVKSIGPAGIPPVILSKSVSLALKKKIQEVLLNMHLDKEGRSILDMALVDHFTAVSASNYDGIRKMYAVARKVKKEKIK